MVNFYANKHIVELILGQLLIQLSLLLEKVAGEIERLLVTFPSGTYLRCPRTVVNE